MGSYAYLTCSDFRGIYPIERAKGFDPAREILLCDKDFVPLLWFGLFREDDLKQARVPELPSAACLAPVAKRDEALSRLEAATSILESTYPALGPLGAHVDALASYVADSSGRYVSIEWHELALQHGEREFAGWVRRIFRHLADPRAELDAEARVRREDAALPRIAKLKLLRAHARSLSMQEAMALLSSHGDDVDLALARLRSGKSELEQELDATDALASLQRRALPISAVYTHLSGIRPTEALPAAPSPASAGAWNLTRILGTAHLRTPPWEATG